MPQSVGRLNHVAIATPNVEKAAALYASALGAKVSAPSPQPAHGVTVVFVELPNATFELMEPLGDHSPIKGFLEKNPAGGLHHVCLETSNIIALRDQLKAHGVRVLGDGEPKIGAHGEPVLFVHPKDFDGVLVELEEV